MGDGRILEEKVGVDEDRGGIEERGRDDMVRSLHLSSTSAPCCRYFRAKLKSTSLP
jgi:hypothetical protein